MLKLELASPNQSFLSQVKSHPFVATIDWVAVSQRRVTPPFQPTVSQARPLQARIVRRLPCMELHRDRQRIFLETILGLRDSESEALRRRMLTNLHRLRSRLASFVNHFHRTGTSSISTRSSWTSRSSIPKFAADIAKKCSRLNRTSKIRPIYENSCHNITCKRFREG